MFNLSPHQKKAMHHLFLTRKAASTLTSAFRYYKGIKEFKQKNAQNPLYKELIVKGISIAHVDQEVKRKGYLMQNNIHDFRDERIALKRLKVNDGHEQRKDLFFIKGEILDLQQKFLQLIHSDLTCQELIDSQTKLIKTLATDQRFIINSQLEFQRHFCAIEKALKPISQGLKPMKHKTIGIQRVSPPPNFMGTQSSQNPTDTISHHLPTGSLGATHPPANIDQGPTMANICSNYGGEQKFSKKDPGEVNYISSSRSDSLSSSSETGRQNADRSIQINTSAHISNQQRSSSTNQQQRNTTVNFGPLYEEVAVKFGKG
ncbi:hypothetical protein FGO68_gene17211 [Halteria grandinella]|uniref:Uncharacterized protein n=1 Tax=Halteria grandinella TaxID=5974 RepID=A0A8J8P3N9_HALGN|nr:hypothetical protein FGO68_gene17211 [Halteria grandinella]